VAFCVCSCSLCCDQPGQCLLGTGPIRFSQARRGFTLIELLVAASIAMSVMAAVASLFTLFGRAASNGQSVVEMSARMRTAAANLSRDLRGLTVRPVPSINPESASGYFELIEGPLIDGNPFMSGSGQSGNFSVETQGDTDDAILFTTQSPSQPFVGRYNSTQLESTTAEVAWFCQPATTQSVTGLTLYTIYRRQLLVTAYVGAAPFLTDGTATNNQIVGTLPAAYNSYDLSLQVDPTTTSALLPNSLADLTLRENRFCHTADNASFPLVPSIKSTTSLAIGVGSKTFTVAKTSTYAVGDRVKVTGVDPSWYMIGVITNLTIDSSITVNIDTVAGSGSYADWTFTQASPSQTLTFNSASLREGEDIVLTNVLGFDVRVFDPEVKIKKKSATPAAATALYPADPGYYGFTDLSPSGTSSTGAFVDLGFFASANDSTTTPTPFTVGPQTSSGLPASPATYDTWSTTYEALAINSTTPVRPPPYAVPLRGIEVRIRCYDPSSKLVRQVTVRHVFSR